MSSAESPASGDKVSMGIGEAHARLSSLDVKERQHWVVAITIMLALAAGLFAFTLPGVAETIMPDGPLRFALRGITVLVVCFGVLALRKQRIAARVRHEVASELAVIAAAETLKVAVGNNAPAVERRSSVRAACDERLDVFVHGPEGLQQYYGRIVDICEHGLGAIVPCMLNPGQEVILQFALNHDESLAAAGSASESARLLKLSATVRQRSGFRYGFNFVAISESDREEIENYRVGGQKVLSIAQKM